MEIVQTAKSKTKKEIANRHGGTAGPYARKFVMAPAQRLTSARTSAQAVVSTKAGTPNGDRAPSVARPCLFSRFASISALYTTTIYAPNLCSTWVKHQLIRPAMRLLTLTPLLFLLSPTPLSPLLVSASADSGLYPPGLLPLINKANILLSTDQSPADYLLYYKRATAYFSMQRHSSALEDFEKVLSLTSNTFDNAHLMKARIHTREGAHALARASLTLYIKAKGKDKEAEELEGDLTELERVRGKTEKERNAGLWNAYVETASGES
ncbi:hypothetical protein BJ165DRAFT_1532443 [Panaeolus papilionaceus]|nr:hypothetical protein BJ165DRAFT_1532443 [Panaeolus papilionaceus]